MKKIENKHQYDTSMAQIESYLQKGLANLSEKEEHHLDELSRSLEEWELKTYPMPMNPSFQEILTYVMKNKKMSHAALSQSLEVSESLLSEILTGKKQPDVDMMRNLHCHFHIDGNILLESIQAEKKAEEKKKSPAIRTGKTLPSKPTF